MAARRFVVVVVAVACAVSACSTSTSEITATTPADDVETPAADTSDAGAAAEPTPTQPPTAVPVDESGAIDEGAVVAAAARVDELLADLEYDDGFADVDACPSPTIEDLLLTEVPDRVADEALYAESARWSRGEDLACIVSTEQADGPGSAAIAYYRGAAAPDDYIEDVAFFQVDDRSTVGVQRGDIGDHEGGSLHDACIVYEEEFGYCEVFWFHPDGLVVTFWTTVIDDRARLRDMQAQLVTALPGIVADLNG